MAATKWRPRRLLLFSVGTLAMIMAFQDDWNFFPPSIWSQVSPYHRHVRTRGSEMYDEAVWNNSKEIEDALVVLKEAGILQLDSEDENKWIMAVDYPLKILEEGNDRPATWRRISTISTTEEAEEESSAGSLFESDSATLFTKRELEEEGEEEKSNMLFNGSMAGLCVCVAALASGLTMGMLSLDPLMLMIKIRAGSTQRERDSAAALLPLVRQHHQLLVTLLLMNSMANEALPIFLDRLVPSYIAIILSVTFLLFFGEIIPSALFTGPNQMAIASALVPLLRLVMTLLCPIAWPIAKSLDYFLHDDDDDHSGMSMYNRGELSALVRIQYEERLATKKRRKEEMVSFTAPPPRRQQQRSDSAITPIARPASRSSSFLTAAVENIRASFSSAPAPPPPPATKTMSVTPAELAMALKNNLSKNNTELIPTDPTTASASTTPLLSTSPSDPSDLLLSKPPFKYGARTSSKDHPKSLGNSLSAATLAIEEEGEASFQIRSQNSIHLDEVTMIEGALAMKTTVALDVYTPLRDVFAVPLDMKLDEINVVNIYTKGYSRVPVYFQRDNEGTAGAEEEEEDRMAIRGVLLTKQLIVVNPKDCRPISTLPLHVPQCVAPTTNLVDLINMFQAGSVAKKGGHMALVCVDPDMANEALDRGDVIPLDAGVMGVVTLEDVLEELLQEEIYDEMDKAEQESVRRSRSVIRKWKLFVKKRKMARKRYEQRPPYQMSVV